MATQKKITKVEGGTSSPSPKPSFVPTAEAKGKATQNRVIAVVLWILAIAAQLGAIYYITHYEKGTDLNWVLVIGLIVVDVALVIVGAILWKKSNRLDPPSEKKKFLFFMQSQLGLFAAIVAFLPLVIVIFTNKNLDGKQKGILGGIAIAALVAAGLVGTDFNPPSQEQYAEQTSRVEELTGANTVYWTKSGTKYHIYEDCHAINTSKTDEIFSGTVAQARELKNITELCKFCENKAVKAKDTEQLPNLTEETTAEELPQATEE